MGSSTSTLTPIQVAVLEAFRGSAAWLTGGGALGGFHLGRRASHDLDLFAATSEAHADACRRFELWAADNGRAEVRQKTPGFVRYLFENAIGDTLVDVVREPVEQIVAPEDKPVIDGLRVDPLVEIRANKLAALLGRSETKDLFDLWSLEEAGLDALEGLEHASRKDAGIEPSTLAWVLASMPIRLDELLLREPLDPAILAEFRERLATRLRQSAFPDPDR